MNVLIIMAMNLIKMITVITIATIETPIGKLRIRKEAITCFFVRLCV